VPQTLIFVGYQGSSLENFGKTALNLNLLTSIAQEVLENNVSADFNLPEWMSKWRMEI